MQLQHIQTKISELRGYEVMLDSEMAELYETETKRLKEAVRRSIDRFPSDFMFEVNIPELESLRTQFASSNRGGTRYLPFVFIEQGVAIEVYIQIVRAFVFLRQYSLTNTDLTNKQTLKTKDKINTKQIQRKRIGFKTNINHSPGNTIFALNPNP